VICLLAVIDARRRKNKKADAVLNGFGFFALRSDSAAKRACMLPMRVGRCATQCAYWAGAAGFL
jgi:hypothetical protein